MWCFYFDIRLTSINFAAMITKTQAVVLHSFKYGESKLIADMLTETEGRMQCIATVTKSPRGRLKRQYFQPLTMLEIVFERRPGVSLQKLKDARVLRPFTSIPFDPLKLSIAMFTAEFLGSATRGEQTDRSIFAYIVNSITWLDECRGQFSNFHLVFAMRLTRFLGFYPNTEDGGDSEWFDLRSGCFSPVMPPHTDRLAPGEARLIGLMLRMNFATMHLYRMNRGERNRLLEVILDFYRLHIPDFRPLKSVEVLKELF